MYLKRTTLKFVNISQSLYSNNAHKILIQVAEMMYQLAM